MITIRSDDGNLEVKTFKFSGGELQTSINELVAYPSDVLNVIARLNNPDDIIELLLIDELLTRNGCNYELTIPYLPYGRQDRVMQYNEAFSLKVMARLLNDLSCSRIYTYDCHSHVTPALIGALNEIKQADIIDTIASADKLLFRGIINNAVIIAPDTGASKKAYEVARNYNRPIGIAEKIRDVSTGDITHTKIDLLPEEYNTTTALIIDDICDGGRTFIGLAKVLRDKGFNYIYLYVTHGIFSQGLDIFDGIIDYIFTTDTFRDESWYDLMPIEPRKMLTVFKVV